MKSIFDLESSVEIKKGIVKSMVPKVKQHTQQQQNKHASFPDRLPQVNLDAGEEEN